MFVVTVSGTPATGKTSLAKQLALKQGYCYIDVKLLIEKKKLQSGYDKKRDCMIVDIDLLNKEILKKISLAKKSGKLVVIIDSHLSHYLDPSSVDLCIITKCSLKQLSKRLKKRGYSDAKIRENLDAEIFDVCYNEAKELGHKVLAVKTTLKVSGAALKKLHSVISGIAKQKLAAVPKNKKS